MNIYKLYLSCILVVITGCVSRDVRLVHIQEIVNDTPEKTLALLDSIDRNELNEADRNFYDLMMVKSTDKAYMTHTSDSTILRVKNYYRDKEESDEYFEAVYYCGRVSYDLGDFPEAMKYFQNVIDMTEKTKSKKRLEIRGNALAFIEYRLTYLELYDEAIPYLNEMVRVDSILKDTINLITDYKSLGYVYLCTNKYDKAERILKKGRDLATLRDSEQENLINTYLGGVAYKMRKYRTTLEYMWQVLSNPDSISESRALNFGAYSPKLMQN